MSLNNCKVELKLKWIKYCVLSAAGNDNVNGKVNDNVNGNYIIFTIENTKLYVPVRGGSRTAATSKLELFVIIVKGLKPLTIITKSSTLDVATVLDPPLPVVTLSARDNHKLSKCLSKGFERSVY